MNEKIKEVIIKILLNKNIDINSDNFVIEKPSHKENGDLSTNIAMQLAKVLKRNPMEIAEELVSEIKDENILKIEIKSPGFINFFLQKDYLFQNINKVLKKASTYGQVEIGLNQKINVEFVSANPTGLIHIGTARNAAHGDNLCRILSFAGYSVTREYYFNDAGVQIDNLGKSLLVRYQEKCGINTPFPENGYHGNEIKEIAEELFTKYQDSKLNEELSFFAIYAKDYLSKIIKDNLKDFRVTFDIWTSEQDIRKSGKIEESLKILKDRGNIYESDGATWLKTTTYGDDKDRVIIKSDGNYTYIVPDIAYHLDKINRGYDEIIDILGADHHGYISRLKASIEALGFNANKILIKIIQMVRLLKNGQEIKMSKRTGQTVTMRELMDEIGTNAARYFFAARSIDAQMDFDLDLAKKKSNENPVYYVCYAYARICTILENFPQTELVDNYVNITSGEAYNVLNIIYDFENIVTQAATKKLPHLITNYVYELANSFHSYYEKERIITADKNSTRENINLIRATKITIENALNLIGVIPPKKM